MEAELARDAERRRRDNARRDLLDAAATAAGGGGGSGSGGGGSGGSGSKGGSKRLRVPSHPVLPPSTPITAVLATSLVAAEGSPHARLGVHLATPAAQVTARYRAMALHLHPDKPTGSEAAFVALNEAYGAVMLTAPP